MEPKLSRPLMIFDGNCSFCQRWIARWKKLTGDAIDYEPYQSAAERFPAIPHENFRKAVHLIEPDHGITRGAEAVFISLAKADRYRPLLWLYRHVPPFAAWSERAYNFIARHRDGVDRFDLMLLGKQTEPATYLLTQSIFLRALAVIYFIAFLSLFVQIDGLLGSHGILPAQRFLQTAREFYPSDNNAPSAHWAYPTLAWMNSSDRALHLLCFAGMVCSVLMMIGVLPAFMLAITWACYLSLVVIGQEFLAFQWDLLLLEAGFLAILFAPLLHLGSRRPPSRMVLFLLRWLLFRVMFFSAAVKLLSDDSTWQSLTALKYHFETQPLPVWTSWYLHQLPLWVLKIMCFLLLATEGLVPLLYFLPRRPRYLGFWITVVFQCVIMLTGNFGFFNLLVIVLCIPLVEDSFWPKLLRRRRFPEIRFRQPWIRRAVLMPIAAVILLVTLCHFRDVFRPDMGWPAPVAALYRYVGGFRSANTYGLFALMTTHRPEIILEGSNDGKTWRAYGFKYKPDELTKPPRFCIPHMPRVDWQFWFAAFEGPAANQWVAALESRLLEGEPSVLSLMGSNPFPDAPPRFVRATVYEYHFTTAAERAAKGEWWIRKAYSPLLFSPVMKQPPKPASAR